MFRAGSADPLNPKNSLASPTPIVDGDRVYVHFGADGTAALTSSGEIVWKTRLPYESQHGNGGSPVLFGDLLIVSCDGSDEAFVVGARQADGEGPLEDRSPAAVRPGLLDAARDSRRRPRSDRQRRRLPGGGLRSGVGQGDLAGQLRGRLLECAAPGLRPRPRLHRDRIPAAVAARRPRRRHRRCDPDPRRLDAPARRAATRRRPCSSATSSTSSATSASRPVSMRRRARLHWQQRLGGNFSASPMFADGRIYFLSEEGVATVIAPGKEFRKLATNQLDGATLASMAVSGGSIFIRSDTPPLSHRTEIRQGLGKVQSRSEQGVKVREANRRTTTSRGVEGRRSEGRGKEEGRRGGRGKRGKGGGGGRRGGGGGGGGWRAEIGCAELPLRISCTLRTHLGGGGGGRGEEPERVA